MRSSEGSVADEWRYRCLRCRTFPVLGFLEDDILNRYELSNRGRTCWTGCERRWQGERLRPTGEAA